MRATIRRYEPGDLGELLRLWQQAGCVPRGEDGLTVDQAVELLASPAVEAFVAEAGGRVVGSGLASASATVGWIHRLIVRVGEGDGEVADLLLERLEATLAGREVRKVAATVAADGAARGRLGRGGYAAPPGMLYLEHALPPTSAAPRALAELGGGLIGPGLWEELKGLDDAKEVIERRVILPLAEPGLAARHAVAPPRAIVLFGPPGTGKTTFAKGIASRLGWPFVEVEPRRVGGEGPEREADLLARTFDRLLELQSVVAFMDEVEDVAASRDDERRVSPSVTNELLRQIPRMRQLDEHLLVCATNWIDRLDPAFLRPGRFDYVLAVGPPDPGARRSIWQRYVEEITDEPIDLDALVDRTELFTPADIEFAARKAAQRAFEREHFDRAAGRASTRDFLAAITQTRPSLSREVIDGFEADTRRFARS
jgi:hypothetical protein